ncbi:uncharacterized protein METZ01_LOCUS95617 [marine metagenome]|uniref:Arsenate reductase n=1 Tax=marine metagenome TaxID=408172 RepID=A0A381VT73_9ZZZZ|tara:strand:+ start:9575 stop:9925 length:351 start_codon:yes stop_codon:yes gene_type:complete
MSDFIIYHNPRCSKSRQTLELLKNNNITPLIRLYLEDPPNKRELKGILEKLNISPRELMRKNEEDYKKNNLSDLSIPEDKLLSIMTLFPKLIERPIVIKGNKAVLGRPPENVKEII